MADKKFFTKKFASEEDQTNCSFYYKVGACRNGSNCLKDHTVPTAASTVLVPCVFRPLSAFMKIVKKDLQQIPHLCELVEDPAHALYWDFYHFFPNKKDIVEMLACENAAEHLAGSLFIQFRNRAAAAKGMEFLRGTVYRSTLVFPSYSPVTNFRESVCKQHGAGLCSRKALCNFVHELQKPPALQRLLATRTSEVFVKQESQRERLYKIKEWNRRRRRS